MRNKLLIGYDTFPDDTMGFLGICGSSGITGDDTDVPEIQVIWINGKLLSRLLEQKVAALPWDQMESTLSDLERTLSQNAVDLGEFRIRLTREELLRAAASMEKPYSTRFACTGISSKA